MSTFGKVLASLNLVTIIALLVLASGSVKARRNFAQTMENLAKNRDGLSTDELARSGRAAAKQEGELSSNSEFAQRRKAGQDKFEATKELPFSKEAQDLLKNLGPEDFKELVQMHIKLEQPKLTDEERTLTKRKILLLTLKSRNQKHKAELDAEIARLKADLTQETDLEKKVQALNVERRREIARLYADLEEALAARNLAQGNLRNVEDYLKQTVEQAQALRGQNQDLAAKIQGQELGR